MASGEGVEEAAEEEQIRNNAEALECAVQEELRLQQQIQDTENNQCLQEEEEEGVSTYCLCGVLFKHLQLGLVSIILECNFIHIYLC